MVVEAANLYIWTASAVGNILFKPKKSTYTSARLKEEALLCLEGAKCFMEGSITDTVYGNSFSYLPVQSEPAEAQVIKVVNFATIGPECNRERLEGT